MADAVSGTSKAQKTHQLEVDHPPPKSAKAPSRNATTPVWDDSRVATSASATAAATARTPVSGSSQDLADLNKTFTDSKSLALEIERLKESGATPMTIIMRQAQWVQMAKKEGLEEPSGTLDPGTATREQVARARVWSEIGGVIPRSELEKDGGKSYLGKIRDAVAAQKETPDQRLAATGKQLVDESKQQDQQKYIGLDGRVGTEQQVVFYERNEAIAAMYGDTTIGGIAANVPNVAHPGGPVDVPQMRSLGTLADNTEAGFGHCAAALPAPANAPHCTLPARR